MIKATYNINAFMWGLAYCFRGLVHDHHSAEPSDRDRDGAGAVAESFGLIHKQEWGSGEGVNF